MYIKSHKSTIVEDSLSTISRRNPSTRFVKLHHEIAEMRHIQAPALLAYRAGDVFATVVDIFRSLPEGRFCSAESLEGLLRVYVFFFFFVCAYFGACADLNWLVL